MTNTIPNVPRELLERASNLAFQTQHYPLHEDLHTLLSAPSPAGVDGLNTDRNAAFKACPESGCDWGSFYLGWKARGEVEQAIIDGLRGENHQLQRELRLRQSQIESSGRIAERAQRFAVALRTERDQHAQRIGELEADRDSHQRCAIQAMAELAAIKAQGVVMPAELDRAFITGESCDGVYRVAIQSETLKEMQAVHNWLARLNATPVQQVSVPDGHSNQDKYEHFLSYSGLSDNSMLRYAYFHGADDGIAAPAAPAADAVSERMDNVWLGGSADRSKGVA